MIPLGSRIARLYERMKCGDPDIPEDEFQAAIDMAEAKRRESQEEVGTNVLPANATFMSHSAELLPPPSRPKPRRQSASRAESARLLTRIVRRKNPAGAIAG